MEETTWTARSTWAGWVMVYRAPDRATAVSIARDAAYSASLLPTDIDSVTAATDDDVRQYKAMGGRL